jgi:hypothetical protein
MIDTAFNGIAGITGDQKVDLIKIVMMQLNILQVGISHVQDLKIRPVHFLAGIKR